MKKPIKLLLYLLLSAAILFLLWARMDCPRLTAESALSRVESANLAPKSTFLRAASLGVLSSRGGTYERFLAAGVTDTHLHMAEVREKGLLWYNYDSFYHPLASVPLKNEPLTGFAPDYWPFDYTFFLYTSQPMELWVASLTIGDSTYTTDGSCHPSGFTLFRFPQLEDCEDDVGSNLKAWAYDMLGMGYNQDSKVLDMTLEVTLYPHIGGQPVRVVQEYPANE